MRDTINPEFEEELKKHNFGAMFWQFQAWPMWTHPEEMDFFQPDHIKKLSKWDLRRMQFVHKFRMNQKMKEVMNLWYAIDDVKYKYQDLVESEGKNTMTYKQIVESMHEEYKKIENIDNPLQIHKTEKE